MPRTTFQSGRFKELGYVVATLLASTSTVWSPAAAQQASGATPSAATPAGQDADGIAEIIVVAQRRSENLQRVPIAITAVTGAAISQRGIRSSEDLSLVMPGLTTTRTVSTPLLYARGIGTYSVNPTQEPNVALYVDGVYYSTVVTDASDFGRNLDHIEFLKGPQGTLFGRNANGGLVHIVSKDPTQELSGAATIEYGNYQTVRASAYVAGGWTDRLASDLSVNFGHQGKGFGRNIFLNTDVNYRNNLNLRSKSVWRPVPGTKFTLAGDYNRVRSDWGNARQVTPGQLRTPASLGGIVFDGNIYDTQANSPSFDRIQGGGISLKAEHDAGPFQLVNILAHRRIEAFRNADLDTTPANAQSYQYNPQTSRTTSEELQILSPSSNRLRWVAGIYIFHESAGVHPLQINQAALGAALYQKIDVSLTTDSYAAYAQATLPFFDDHTRLTVGARYTIDDKRISGTVSNALTLLSTPNQHVSFGEPTFRVALDQDLSDDILAYASVNRGFKSGVYNATSPNAAPVRPETLTSYEAGIKSDLLGRRLRVNLAAFYYDYKDIQLTAFVGSSTSLTSFVNAARAHIYGGELEVYARPTKSVTLSGGLAYLHARFADFSNAQSIKPNPLTGLGVQSPVDASGFTLERSPTLTANTMVEFSWRAGASPVNANISYYYNSGVFFTADNNLRQRAYSLVNARLGVRPGGGRIEVAAWARNLLDKEYYTQILQGVGGPIIATPGQPRTYGASLGVTF